MSPPSEQDQEALRRELRVLFTHIKRIRLEIAAIRRPGVTDDRLAEINDELDAIVAATESATNTIMSSTEEIERIVAEVTEELGDSPQSRRLADVVTHVGSVFEACAFQDITGQRVNKVVKSLKFIEDRLNALIQIWGEAALAKTDPPGQAAPKDEYQGFLHGPQLAGKGHSQAEIDTLLNGGTVKLPASAGSKPLPAAGPAPAPPPKPEPKPEPKPPAEQAPEGQVFSQSDIDKLFD